MAAEEKQDNKAVLLFATRFESKQSPNAICLKSVINSFPNNYRFIVISSRESIDEPELITRGKVTTYQLYNSYGAFLAKKWLPEKMWKIELFARRVLSVINPWPLFLWEKRAFSLASKIVAENNICLLISNSLPFSCHGPAKKIKKQHPSIPWVAYVLDPFTKNPICHSKNPIANILSTIKEKAVFQECDRIVTLSNLEYDDCLNKKIARVGIPLLDGSTISLQGGLGNGCLTYGGSFLRGVREPQNVLQIIEAYCRRYPDGLVQFSFYTNIESRDAEAIAQTAANFSEVKVQGYIPKEEMNDVLKASMGLVSIGNLSPLQIPSKVIEYVGFGRPVVHFAFCQDDPVVPFLKEYPLSCVVYLDASVDANVNQLRQFILSIRNLDSVEYERGPYLKSCESEYTAKLIEELAS